MFGEDKFKIKEKDYIYDRQSVDYLQFWQHQLDICRNGTVIDGTPITGALYFFLNFWTIEVGGENEKDPVKRLSKPYLRDIDWDVFNAYKQAREQSKGLIIISGRGAGKSYWGTCFIGHQYTCYENSESVLSCGNEPDNLNFMNKLQTGLSNLPPIFKYSRIVNNIKQEIREGYKDKNNEVITTNRRILVRNFDDGSNTMVCNGLRPVIQVFDEVGKMKNLIKCYSDTQECWMSGSRQFGCPILTGTGGNMEKGEDASKMFRNPEPYNLLAFEDTYNHRDTKVGLFIAGNRCLNDYKDEQGNTIQEESKQYILNKREEKRAGDKSAYFKYLMYYPLNPDEAFLIDKGNIFNIAKLNEDLAILKTVKKYKEIIQLGNLEWEDPNKKGTVKWIPNKNGVFKVLFHPKKDDKIDLYIAGTDPYDIDVSYKGSLGSTFVYKRFDNAEEVGNLVAAEYTDRPLLADTYYENVLKLMIYFNCKTLCEANQVGMINYFQRNNRQYYLLPVPSLLHEINPNSRSIRKYGIVMTKEVKEYMELAIRDYIEENCGSDLKTNEPGKILFPDLLDELVRYNNEGNFDRVIAFGLCLIHKAEVHKKKVRQSKSHDNYYKMPVLVRDENNRLRYYI